jgi:hypothetical protein
MDARPSERECGLRFTLGPARVILMAERPRQRSRCRTCRTPPLATPVQDAAEKAASKLKNTQVDLQVITVVGEADRLWRHVLFGTGTCIGMLAGYAALSMPGNPLPELRALRQRIDEIIKSLERNNASRNASRNAEDR